MNHYISSSRRLSNFVKLGYVLAAALLAGLTTQVVWAQSTPDPGVNPFTISILPTSVEEEEEFTITYNNAGANASLNTYVFHEGALIHRFAARQAEADGSGEFSLLMPHVMDIVRMQEDGFVVQVYADGNPSNEVSLTVTAGGSPTDIKPLACTSGVEYTINSDVIPQGGNLKLGVLGAQPDSNVTLEIYHDGQLVHAYDPKPVNGPGQQNVNYTLPNLLDMMNFTGGQDGFRFKVKEGDGANGSEWFTVTITRT